MNAVIGQPWRFEMPEDLKSLIEKIESSDQFIARHNLERLNKLIGAQVQSPGPDDLPDELGFNSCI
ncbi:hypothetical protein D7S89_03340 [Trinickia fusca]|uniref:Uncharacterized protein n=2 Tax=Trinickia fusca TaxID=2419777 RepID=A0A494XRV2_9BURK|nr:hypothetical protein D7S89_03340 [Trinickia fusca]